MATLSAAGQRPDGVCAGMAVTTARLIIPARLRFPTRVAITRAIALTERRKARRLLRSRPLLLYLGSGYEPKQGWINVDLVGATADIYWDLRKPLPFPDDCVAGACLEHVLEHFDLAHGLDVLANCFRVLQPNGILRVVVPHVLRYAESYVKDPAKTYINTVRPGQATALLAFQQIFYCYGHRMAYDSETLDYVLRRVGFVAIGERQFDDTDLPIRPDTESRRLESLYVECRKPTRAE